MTITLASGSTALVGSVTRPVREAFVDWARRAIAHEKINMATRPMALRRDGFLFSTFASAMRMDVLRSILLKSLTLKQKIDGKIFRVSYCKPLTRNRKDGQHSHRRAQRERRIF